LRKKNQEKRAPGKPSASSNVSKSRKPIYYLTERSVYCRRKNLEAAKKTKAEEKIYTAAELQRLVGNVIEIGDLSAATWKKYCRNGEV